MFYLFIYQYNQYLLIYRIEIAQGVWDRMLRAVYFIFASPNYQFPSFLFYYICLYFLFIYLFVY